jgi:hypothetical protein
MIVQAVFRLTHPWPPSSSLSASHKLAEEGADLPNSRGETRFGGALGADVRSSLLGLF